MSSLSSLPLAVSDSFHLRPRRTQTFLIRKELSEVNYFRLSQRCFTVASTDYASVKQPNLTKPSPPIMPPFHYTPPPYIGPTTDEIIAMRKEYLSPAMIPFYENPLNLVNGKRQYLFDEKGKRYVDAFAISAAAPCGHCHPVVEEALFKQVKLLQHNNVIYLNHTITDYAKALAEKMPGNLKVFYFLNSGTEANELAILMARLYTGRNDIISLRNAYHGLATSAMGTNGLYTEKFDVVQTGFQHALNPDPYRGPFGSDGEKYAEDVQNIINYGTPGKVAGFIAESIQGVGGIVELAPGYLPAVYKIIKEAGGLCIADEAIIGFGRTGSNYWGFENHDVVPDIVTMAKGIGNGAPLSAVVTTPEIAQVLTSHRYYSTFAGNPASTAAALAVLKVIDKENLQRNANVVGSHLKERLTSLKSKHEIIGDVRGRGFMLGVEFVTDRKLKTPAIAETKIIFEKMKELGVLVGKGGLYGNVFRITPPLCFTKPDADYLVDVLDYILSTNRG